MGLTAHDMSDMGRLAQLAMNPGTGTSREEIYLAVASLYRIQGTGLNDRERELMREILRRLTRDVEMAIRIALAQRLCDDSTAPHDLIMLLVDDSIEVARPLILNSPLLTEAEHRVAQGLLRARLVRAPQVTIEVTEIRAHQAAVLGFVVHPGRYPLESSATHLSELMAQAGGTTPDAADLITVSGTRNGKPMRMTVDFRQLTTGADREHDIVIRNNDIVYAPRAPQVYVYGEVQRPGTVRLEPGMRVLQALAAAGGLTLRGTQRGIRVSRPGPDGQLVQTTPGLQAVLQPEDVVYVPESLF